ncbi:hypothetical protein ASPZODRAFT_70310 [Penicilliopsis zonata CBS 506.65]|uniref:F-box domain-containing protein n=1 Tax=Penicilliopsis zonata CBS 506.65 TaxID=1073090 RepID=A0A1L9SD97_9EURO|nr:hypothetical protein ASPZODRAFT_70310 [Penicilliopsis zonata CBS 506.65]OJJ45064.1 hypothetical protein ASPZODRAFT_70310 [Penicilliopsis zonata CBS 506.65]
MQSEPIAVTQRPDPGSPPAEPRLPSQNGFQRSGGLESSSLPPGDGVGEAGVVVNGGLGLLRRGSPDRSTASSPSVDRISQYENAWTGSPRKPGEVGFRVVASSGRPRLTLEAFPNEVLTHILSHLPPASLSSVTLVCRRFHNLVTTPHAWRSAFSRYFPGPYTVENGSQAPAAIEAGDVVSDKRVFARLTALASWRSEYILRTRLLRSLARGKPTQFQPTKKHGTVRSANVRNGSAIVTYTSNLLYPVSHLHGSFATKKAPLFIHGAVEQGIASASDPSTVKVGTWGLSDHQMFRHFADLFPGDAEYGLGAGDIVGQPNCMDVSQPFGMIYGEGCPQGRSYFILSAEHRGRFLSVSDTSSQPELGIPALNMITHSTTAVWIAKTPQILKMSGGMIAMLAGSSSGVLSAYSLGPHPAYERRYERGQVTARWVLSPGVPIIGIAVDDSYSTARQARRRIFAVVLNALGEVFYLTDLPQQPRNLPTGLSAEILDQMAWKTGRSARWELVELSRRIPRPDPFNLEPVDGSYSPRSSSDSMKLSVDQIAAETKDIEQYLMFKPKHFRKVCESWNMRRDLQVDFAGDDGNGSGESVTVITRGTGEDEKASIRRFARKLSPVGSARSSTPDALPSNVSNSIFGGPVGAPSSLPSSRDSSHLDELSSLTTYSEWYITDFHFGDRKGVRITTTAIDMSIYSILTIDEDPLLSMSGRSTSSSAMSSPMPHMKQSSSSDVPGQRARYLAAGTDTGQVFVWDLRAPSAQNSEVINSAPPLRVIQTDSPQVSCVALSSLCLVHGGNDGLVQAWDPLASITRPIRTMNSRFSSRARRRLVQAEASIQGVGNNYYAAGAISLDPDPTVLRGMVSLGTHVRYWSYSSSAADQYKSSKRRFRHSQRGSNSDPEGQRFSNTGRGALQDFIEDERIEMERQRVADEKEQAHLSSRFGVDLLGADATEDQILAYARLLSEETYTSDVLKRGQSVDCSVASTSPSDTIGPHDSPFAPEAFSSSSSPYQETADHPDDDDDLAEAIRLSLLDEQLPPFEPSPSIPIKYGKGYKAAVSQDSNDGGHAESSRQQEMDDLEFALQLSLVEEHSRNQAEQTGHQEFPILLSSGDNKGKGRAL